MPHLRMISSAFALSVSALLATPLAAQSALDRVEPDEAQTRLDDRGRDTGETGAALPAAQQRRSTAAASNETISVSSIIISGNEALADSAFVDLIEAFTSRPLSQTDLALLADSVAERARDQGYIFATATIPQQALSLGVLRVTLDEGTIDDIRFEGASDGAIRRQLQPLVNGQPVRKDELERRILLADDISGVRILDTRYEKEEGRGILVVRTRRSRTSASVELANNGSEPVGPIRARIDVDFNGLIFSADEVDVTFGTTPFQPEELQFARAAYRIVVDASGLELGAHLSYSATEPGDFLADREIEGEFWRAGVEARYPVLRRRATSLWVVGEFEVTELRQDRQGDLARRDRVPVVRAGIYSRGRLFGGGYRGQLMLSHGLDILDATQPGDILASRLDASADFTSLYGFFAWDRRVGNGFSVGLGARGQIANNPVLATEDIGIGGTSFVRGYDFNERSGDYGIMGFGELRYNWRGRGFWLPRAQAYVFADGGAVGNLEGGFGSGSLASAGGGLRLDVTRDLDLDFEVAVPLTGERLDSESEAPLINIRVQQSF